MNSRRERHRLASLLAAALLLCGCVGPAHRPAVSVDVARTAAPIYVIRRGWHIDVAVDAADLIPPLAAISPDFPSVRYLVFGFGDRRYLMAGDHGLFAKIAALWPGAALVLVTGLTATPAAAFGQSQVVRLEATAQQLRLLQMFIVESLTDSQPTARGPYEGSLYFEARPRYSALHTCNTWAAEALRSSGFPVRDRGVVFAWQLWSQVRRIAVPAGAIGVSVTKARSQGGKD